MNLEFLVAFGNKKPVVTSTSHNDICYKNDYSNTIDMEKKHPFAELGHEFAILVLKRTKRNADRNITADSYSIRKRHFHF